jgi:mono/diheme cytochrome c family protein
MMPYGSRLSQEQVESVVDYIRVAVMKFPLAQVEAERQGTKPEEQVISDQNVFMAQPLPGSLMGNHKNGGRIFNKNCVPCHGKNGDGQGPRAYFINPKPRNFISNDSRLALNRPKIFKAVTNGFPGTVMPAWGKVFSEQDIADVAEYVFRAFIKADIEPSPVEPGELKKKSKE